VPRPTMALMLRSSIPIGRFLGIDLRVHVSFPLLLALAVIYSLLATGGPWRGVGLWLALLFAVIVREIARTIAVAYSELRLRALFLLPVGGVMALVQRAPGDPTAATLPKAVIVVAPIANVVMGLLLMAMSYAIDPHVALFAQPWISLGHILRSCIWLQFVMAIINLLPTATVPSRQMFRAKPNNNNPQHRGVRTAGARTPSPMFSVGTGLALALLLSGFFLMSYWPMNLWLMLLGGFLLLAAHIRAGQALSENDSDAILVSDVMLTEFTLLSSSDTLQGALARTVHSLQDVFPVVRGDRLVGSVSRQTIADSLQEHGDSYLQGVMTRSLQLASPTEKVVGALRRAGAIGASEFIPVVEGDAMLGILTPQSLSRAVHQVRQTRQRAAVAQERNER
jgi:predicted transcriptional regulator